MSAATVAAIVLLATTCTLAQSVAEPSMRTAPRNDLAEKTWTHGSVDCATSRDLAIEVHEFDADTYILRQNRCVHVEAPFTYVFFGTHTVLVQDTGATADHGRFPLYDTVHGLMARRGGKELQILVTHSHSHTDHTAADSQFRGQPGVTLIEPNAGAVRRYFGFTNWPDGMATGTSARGVERVEVDWRPLIR